VVPAGRPAFVAGPDGLDPAGVGLLVVVALGGILTLVLWLGTGYRRLNIF
jgi:hypothetical protein